ncbi:MAG: ComEC/Rec2 family competence protein [Clostridia bacterium]|nr:ComEC/Rec2 family competence protein [Clostridia bacterium]
MEIFKFRPLALGCTGFLISLAMLYYVDSFLKLAFLALSIIGLGVVIAFYCIKRNKAAENALVFLVPLLIFFILASLLSYFTFAPLREQDKYAGEYDRKLEGYVTEVIEQDIEGSVYIAKLEKIDGDDVSFNVALYTPDRCLDYGYYFEATGQLTRFYDTTSPYMEYGVIYFADTLSCFPIDKEPNAPLSFFKDLNESLCKRFQNTLNSDTSSLFSALLLGNKSELSSDVRNSFSDLGLSHVLALSGLHLSILVAVLSYVLDLLYIPRVLKDIIIVISIAFFMALTGFSSSVLRAGIMLILFFGAHIFACESDRVTNLFISVTAICIFSPFAVFSVSLRLSFLAMLGCLLGSNLTRKATMLRVFKIKPLYHGIVTIIVTLIIMFFTLPVLCSDFGRIALLSPLTNLILVPFFNFLIYLSLVYIFICYVPFLGPFLADILDWLVEMLYRVINWASDIPNITLHIKTPVQLAGAIIAFISVVLMIIFSKQYIKHFLVASVIGVIILGLGTGARYMKKDDGITFGTLGYTRNDIFYVESSEGIVFFDMTTAPYLSLSNEIIYKSWELDHQSIDYYIVTEYYENTPNSISQLLDVIDIECLYLATPLTIKESESYELIAEIATNHGTSVLLLEENVSFLSMDVSFVYEDGIYGSESRMSAISVLADGKRITYLGASAFCGNDKRPAEMCYYSNAIIFGSHGPTSKELYRFDAPHLENVIFLGKSRDYCDYKLFKRLEPIANKTREHRVSIKCSS